MKEILCFRMITLTSSHSWMPNSGNDPSLVTQVVHFHDEVDTRPCTRVRGETGVQYAIPEVSKEHLLDSFGINQPISENFKLLVVPISFHEQCCSVWCNLMIHNDSWNTFWKTINIILICLLSIWIRSHLNFLPQPFKHDDRKLRIRCGRGREILGAFRVSATKIWTSGLLPQLNQSQDECGEFPHVVAPKPGFCWRLKIKNVASLGETTCST